MCPAARVRYPSLLVHLVPCLQDGAVLPTMALHWTEVADAAIPVIVVVPVKEVAKRRTRLLDVHEALDENSGRYFAVHSVDATKALSSLIRGWGCRAVMPNHAMSASSVVAFMVEPLSLWRMGFFGQHRPLGQCRPAQHLDRMLKVAALVDLVADDLAAVDVQDHVQIPEQAPDGGRQVRSQ